MLFAVGCYHCGCREASLLSDPNSSVLYKRTCERRTMHCNATLWDYVPSVAKPLVGLRVDSSAPESNAVSIHCLPGDRATNSSKLVSFVDAVIHCARINHLVCKHSKQPATKVGYTIINERAASHKDMLQQCWCKPYCSNQ